MLIVTINGSDYSLIEDWGEITLKRYIEIDKTILSSCPEALKALQDKDETPLNELSTAQYESQMLPYFARFVAAFSDIPIEVLQKCKKQHLEGLYSVLCANLKRPKETAATGIRIANELYYFPSRFMARETVEDFVEAAQTELALENQNIWEVTARIACILLRKSGESYRDELLNREPIMLSMNMAQAWQFYFFLKAQNEVFALLSQQSLNHQQQSRSAQA